MIPVSLTAVATAIATTLWTKAQEKIGENIGDALWTAPGNGISVKAFPLTADSMRSLVKISNRK